jgi:putative transposase
VRSLFRSRLSLQVEVLALRHQLAVYQRSIKRPLDHVVVLSERHLKEIVSSYLDYYHRWRTHLSLAMDAPGGRPAQPPNQGKVIEFPEVGGLHHHYERLAA